MTDGAFILQDNNHVSQPLLSFVVFCERNKKEKSLGLLLWGSGTLCGLRLMKRRCYNFTKVAWSFGIRLVKVKFLCFLFFLLCHSTWDKFDSP